MYLGKIKLSNATNTDISDIHYDNAGAHNSIYRGKYLGDSVTDEQYAAIDAGTFKDLYIGDYWTINDINWRIAAFDYYYNSGTPACTNHHIVIVPDTILYNEVMNDDDTTATGYVGSKMYSSGLENAKTIIISSFGESHILYKYILFVTAATDGVPIGINWVKSAVEIMSEQMVYGHSSDLPINNEITNEDRINFINETQLSLFSLRPDAIPIRKNWWLRDTASNTTFHYVAASGISSDDCASNDLGVRPSFCIY